MKIFTSNFLKIVAFVTMIIDHFAFYFNYLLSDEIYTLLRIVGRISMPIFAFLIVEGFSHTKSIKKYFSRLFTFATITQISLFILDKIIYRYNPQVCYNVSYNLNILFSFAMSIISLWCIKNIICKFKDIAKIENKNSITKNIVSIFSYTATILIISTLFVIFDFDYGIRAYLLILFIYLINVFIEMLDKNSIVKNKNVLVFFKYILYLFLFISIFSQVTNYTIFANFSLFFIYLYNGKKGNGGKVAKYLFYISFCLQHIILYSISAILYGLD